MLSKVSKGIGVMERSINGDTRICLRTDGRQTDHYIPDFIPSWNNKRTIAKRVYACMNSCKSLEIDNVCLWFFFSIKWLQHFPIWIYVFLINYLCGPFLAIHVKGQPRNIIFTVGPVYQMLFTSFPCFLVPMFWRGFLHLFTITVHRSRLGQMTWAFRSLNPKRHHMNIVTSSPVNFRRSPVKLLIDLPWFYI